MIQRKQTLFLLLATVCLVVAAFMNTGTALMLVLVILSAVLSLGIIFLYKNRKRQAFCTLLPILLLLAWYIVLAVSQEQIVLNHLSSLAEGGGGSSLELAEMLKEGSVIYVWPNLLPLVSILLLFFARKGILHDEKLVRSLDRIR